VALAVAIPWARYWRRLRLLSNGELFEVRYGGVAAGRFRSFNAIYGALFSKALVLGYVLRAFAQVMAPFLGWDPDVVLLVFGGASLAYTVMSGLLGVAYTDMPQFGLLMLGRVVLAALAVGAAGGMVAVLDGVEAARGAEFLRPFPPSPGGLHGDFEVDAWSVLALLVSGFFGASGAGSAAVQRSLAARSEWDAAMGQVFAACLSLVVRAAPMICIGLAAVALFPAGDVAGGDMWGELVRRLAGPGVLGLILVGILAGYMSTIDTMLNLMTAGLFNDVYLRHLRPGASAREQVWFCQGATVAVTGIGVLWGWFLVKEINADWLSFINTVFGVFVLPLSLLRWVWWRLNIWGEVVGYTLGAPLGWVVWFALDFKSAPYWQSFLLLFTLGWIMILGVTLLTRPEPPEVLAAFYQRVRPPGFWGPVRAELSAQERAVHRAEARLDLGATLGALAACAGMVGGLSAAFARAWGWVWVMVALLAVGGAVFVVLTARAERRRRAQEAS
jgi:SSS family solute:Na+ symporter